MDLKLNLLFILICLMVIRFTNAISWRSIERYCVLELDETNNAVYYDVRSLSLKSGYFTIKNNTDTFLINICSPSNDFKSSDNLSVCSKSSSICLINDKYPKGLDLADSQTTELSKNNDSNLVISFNKDNIDQNSTCKVINTKINLICSKKRALETKPEFKEYKLNTDDHSCTYLFEWETFEGCPDSHSVIEPHYKDKPLVFSVNNQTIDLDPIFVAQKLVGKHGDSESYDYIIKHKEYISSTNASLNRYNLSTICDDSFVCQLRQDRSFLRPVGTLAKTELKHANESFHLILFSESKCGRANNRSTTVVFNLYCNDTLNLNQTNIAFKAENGICQYIFDVFAKKVCEFEKLFKNEEQSNTKNATDKSTTIARSTSSTTTEPKIDTKSEATPSKDSTKQPEISNKIIDPKASVQTQNDSNSNTTLFGFIILLIVSVIGIVLAVFSLINDDRRTWLQKKVRRVIKPQNTTFMYSQLSTNNMHLINNNQQYENFNSSYTPTVLPKSNSTNLFNEKNKSINNSFNVKPSIREEINRLSFMNDNDLGVSRNEYSSFSRKTSKDESELDLLT